MNVIREGYFSKIFYEPINENRQKQFKIFSTSFSKWKFQNKLSNIISLGTFSGESSARGKSLLTDCSCKIVEGETIAFADNPLGEFGAASSYPSSSSEE